MLLVYSPLLPVLGLDFGSLTFMLHNDIFAQLLDLWIKTYL